MASVSGPNPAPVYHEGKPNQVLRLTPMIPMIAVVTDQDGKEQNIVIWVFGKMKDGKIGVFLGANPQEVRAQIRVPSQHMIDAIRHKMDEKGFTVNGELTLLNMTGEELAAAQQASKVDTSLFDDTSESSKSELG